MTKARMIALAAAAALGALFATGTLPDSPANRECWQSYAKGPCEVAQQLTDAEGIDCTVGSQVVIPVEVVIDPDAPDAESGQLPPGFVAVHGSSVQIDCSAARRQDKVITTRPVASGHSGSCIAGKVRKDTSGAGDGSSWWAPPGLRTCCGDRCECLDQPCAVVPPFEVRGQETWRIRLCEQRPDLCAQQ